MGINNYWYKHILLFPTLLLYTVSPSCVQAFLWINKAVAFMIITVLNGLSSYNIQSVYEYLLYISPRTLHCRSLPLFPGCRCLKSYICSVIDGALNPRYYSHKKKSNRLLTTLLQRTVSIQSPYLNWNFSLYGYCYTDNLQVPIKHNIKEWK